VNSVGISIEGPKSVVSLLYPVLLYDKSIVYTNINILLFIKKVIEPLYLPNTNPLGPIIDLFLIWMEKTSVRKVNLTSIDEFKNFFI
jgi:hypothetical protein